MSDKQKDPYSAGKCPVCGEYATGTWRHPGAPVKCDNGHLWFRNTNIIATHSGDKIENYQQDNELCRWQNKIRDLVIKESGAPENLIDGSGCDSGDPLDLTLSEIQQAFSYLKDKPEAYSHVPQGDWCWCAKWKHGHNLLQNVNEMNFCPFCSDKLVKGKSK